MEQTTLLEQIKQKNGSVAKLAKDLGIKNRQTLYNYIDHYNKGELTKIPEDVCKYFQKLMINSGEPSEDQIDFINALKNRENVWESIRALGYALTLSKEELAELNERLESLTEHEKYGGKFADPKDEEAYQKRVSLIRSEISKLEEYIQQLTDEKKSLESSITYADYLSIRGDDIDTRLKNRIEHGGYGGPSWQGSADISTVCLADNGEYMVISDRFVRGYGRTELRLYAIIGGSRVHIATYPFEENKSFVKFSLIPKLSYYYEIVDEGFDEEFSSGIMELTNSV